MGYLHRAVEKEGHTIDFLLTPTRDRDAAEAREERERARQRDQIVLDDAIRQRLATLTTDFHKLWDDPGTANRDRKRMLAAIIEDATLLKLPAEGTTRIHLRFKGEKMETLTTLNPKSSAQTDKDTSPAGRSGTGTGRTVVRAVVRRFVETDAVTRVACGAARAAHVCPDGF